MSNILKQFDTVSASEEGAWLHLCIPDTKELAYADKAHKKPLRIKLKGPDCDAWVSFQRKAMRGDKNDEKTQEESAREDAKLFAKMTLEWENWPAEVGECTYENAIKLYRDYKDIRMQALRFVMKRENFTQRLPAD